MAIQIIQGADKLITVRINSDVTADPYDFTGVDFIRACFIKANGQSLYILYLKLTGDTVNTSDIISNIDTTNITEGMPISGPGIPLNATVIATPSSAIPTAANTIQISSPAIATATGVTLELGQIRIINAVIGKIQLHLEEVDTDTLKVGLAQGFEIKIVKDNFTNYIQFPKSYDVLKRFC